MTATVTQLWAGNAVRLHHGICDNCGARKQIARQLRSRKFQCVECFEKAPTGSAELRKRVRAARKAAAAAVRA